MKTVNNTIIAPNNLHTIPNQNAVIEKEILELKAIDHEMKVLKAKYDLIKKRLIESYFNTHDAFVGSEGLVLATYKSQTRPTFLASEFKKDHHDLYSDYTVNQTINVFLLKK